MSLMATSKLKFKFAECSSRVFEEDAKALIGQRAIPEGTTTHVTLT